LYSLAYTVAPSLANVITSGSFHAYDLNAGLSALKVICCSLPRVCFPGDTVPGFVEYEYKMARYYRVIDYFV
jgi:hypothetical protein